MLEVLQKLAVQYYTPKYIHIKMDFDPAIPSCNLFWYCWYFRIPQKGLNLLERELNTISPFTFSQYCHIKYLTKT